MKQKDLPQANRFDFLIGEWNIVNKIEKPDGTWAETTATNRGEKFLDGRVIIDHYHGTVLDGVKVKGITIRSFDKKSETWSIIWLDNRQPPDLTPLVGRFSGDKGEFFQEIPMRGIMTRARFTWDNLSENSARWNQAFSTDGGQTWHMNWVMEFSRNNIR
jgi:hypothetical protein